MSRTTRVVIALLFALLAAPRARAGDHLVFEDWSDAYVVEAGGRTVQRSSLRVRVADNEGVPLLYRQFNVVYLQKNSRRKDFSCKRRTADNRGDSYFRFEMTKINASVAGNLTDEVVEIPSFSKVLAGDAIECQWAVESDDLQFLSSVSLDGVYPVSKRRVEVNFPAGEPVRWTALNGAPAPQASPGRLLWELGPLPALPQRLPQQEYADIVRRVLLTRDRLNFFGKTYPVSNWAEIGDWERSLSGPALDALDDGLRARLAELVQGAKSEREKASRLYDWVRDEHRYVAVELGRGGWQPRPPVEVARNKYGDCKDFATLFASLARAAGLEVALVLVNTRDQGRVAENFPQPFTFDHVIAAVRLGGEWVYADATHKYLPLGLLREDVEGTRALIVPAAGGEARMIELPVAGADENQQIWTLGAASAADGTVALAGSHLVQGAEAGDWRFGMDSADSRADLYGRMQRFYAGKLAGAQSVEIAGQYADVRKPVRVELKAVAGGLVQIDEGRRFVRLLPMKFEREPPGGIPAPAAPLRLGRSETFTAAIRWTLPAAAKIVAPKPVAIRSPFGTLRLDFEKTAEGITVTRELTLTRREIPVAELPDYKAFLLKALEAHSQYFDLGPAP